MKRVVLWSLLIFFAVVLTVLAIIVVPILAHTSAGGSGQLKPSDFVSSVSAVGADGRTRTLEAFEQTDEAKDLSALKPGDIVLVRGSGYDAGVGIYVGFCRIPDSSGERPTPCLGGIPEDAQTEKQPGAEVGALESAWVTNNWAWRPFASHNYSDTRAGEFEVLLVVPPAVGEGLDCTIEQCGLFTRADHTALNDRVQDIYLPISFAR